MDILTEVKFSKRGKGKKPGGATELTSSQSFWQIVRSLNLMNFESGIFFTLS